ncbi:hypothetical protein GCM10018787_45380 [Streptomyces thermodiastaticus]|nr:hypothetical protein GCM10018787_45380 [Streptomyces thermodiastaticus]
MLPAAHCVVHPQREATQRAVLFTVAEGGGRLGDAGARGVRRDLADALPAEGSREAAPEPAASDISPPAATPCR